MRMDRDRFFIGLALIVCCAISSVSAQTVATPSPSWDVYPVRRAVPFGGFSPRVGATFAIRQALDNAKSSVFVQAYSFTSAPIAEALVKVHRRGVKIRVLLDKSQKTEKYSSADFLANAGIPTKIDANHAIAHNKVIIIDNKAVITGSFNLTKAAEESNASAINATMIVSDSLPRQYHFVAL